MKVLSEKWESRREYRIFYKYMIIYPWKKGKVLKEGKSFGFNLNLQILYSNLPIIRYTFLASRNINKLNYWSFVTLTIAIIKRQN